MIVTSRTEKKKEDTKWISGKFMTNSSLKETKFHERLVINFSKIKFFNNFSCEKNAKIVIELSIIV